MEHIKSIFHQGTLKKNCQKATANQSEFDGANAVVQDQLEQANDALINTADTAVEDKDVIKTQLQTI